MNDALQERITLILELLAGTNCEQAARNAIARFRVKGLRIAAAGTTQDAKRHMLQRERELLYAELCNLVAPLDEGYAENAKHEPSPTEEA